MEIEINKVTSGELDGQIVWICDYHQPDFNLKPRRNIPPTKVKIVPNDGKKIYYSESHFVKVADDGSVKFNKFWAPFDNSGYRSFSGHPVSVFDDELDCRIAWNTKISAILAEVQQAKQASINRFDGMLATLQEQIK
jgi:hypothetical protein